MAPTFMSDMYNGRPATSPHTRFRTCIAHRVRRPDTELLRVVTRRNEMGAAVVIPDPRRRLPGRGAWLTPDIGALELAEKRHAFGRALRVPGRVDTEPVRRFLLSQDTGQVQGSVDDQEIVRKTEH